MSNNKDLYSLYGNEYRGSYFKGLKGLSSQARQAFENEYGKYLNTLSEEAQDEEFRAFILKNTLKNHPDSTIASLWDKRFTELNTPEKRNKIWSQLSLIEDLDDKSNTADAKVGPAEWLDWIGQALEGSNPNAGIGNAFYGRDSKTTKDTIVGKKLGMDEDTTIRNQAREYLNIQAESKKSQIEINYSGLPESYKEVVRNNLANYSAEISPNYYGRFGTSTNLGRKFFDALYVNYQSWEDAGGEIYARERLQNFWQDYFASQQTRGEKWANAGVKFGQEIASTAIMAGGLVKGLLGNPGEDNPEGYWKGVIDNEWTRYGADLFTTGQWSKAAQKEYKEKGWDANAILSTVDQERALLSANTPAELFAQYGFTAASMLLSGGLSGLVKGSTTAVVKLGIRAGLKSTAAGRAALKGIIKAGRIAQATVPFAVAMPEATLEALTTRDQSLQFGMQKIQSDIASQIDQDISDHVMSNPRAAIAYINSRQDLKQYALGLGHFETNKTSGVSTKVYTDLDKQRIINLLQNDPQYRKTFEDKYQGYADAMFKQLAGTENTTLWATLGLNMAILGGINSTLQVTQQALGVRRALGSAGKNRFANAVDLIQNGNKWKALAKNVTKTSIFKDRIKEALGEGLEEISQGAISALAEGMADNKVRQYFDYRYNQKEALDAFTEDTWQMVTAGLLNGGEKLMSRETFKEGLYGTLSTLLGGPSVNFNMSFGKKRENENAYDMIARNSPIAWRGIAELAFSSAEQKAKQAENQRIADALNGFFSDEAKQELLFDLIGNLSAQRAYNNSIQSNEEKEARDSKLDILFNTAAMLNALQGTGYYDTVIAMLESRTKFDRHNLDDEMSNEAIAVEEYRLKTGSKDYSENILQEIKDSAQTLLDVINNANKEIADVRKIYGDGVSLDVQNSLVNNRLHIKDTEKRIKQITDELNEIDFSEPNGVTPRSQHSKSIKQGYARYGTFSQAQSAQQALKKKLVEFQEILKRTEEALEEEAVGEGAREQVTAPFKHRIATIENRIASLEAYLTEVSKLEESEKDNIVLNMQDIAELDSESRFAILNPKKYIPEGEEGQEYTRIFSKRQTSEIDKFRRRGQKADSKFLQKIEDLYALEQSNSLYTSLDFSLMSQPKLMLQYAAYVRQQAQEELSLKKYSYLSDMQSSVNASYTDFKRAYTEALRDAVTEEDLASIKENGRRSKHWQKFKQEESEFEELAGQIERTKSYSTLTKEQQQDLNSVLVSLFREGTSFKSTNTVFNRILDLSNSTIEELQSTLSEVIALNKLPVSSKFDAKFILDTISSSLHDITSAQQEMQLRPKADESDSHTGTSPIEENQENNNTVPVASEETTISMVLRNLKEQFKNYPTVLSGLDKIEPIVSNFKNETLTEDLEAAIQNAESTEIKDALLFVKTRLAVNDVYDSSTSTVVETPKNTSGQIESFSTSDLEQMKDSWGGKAVRAVLSRIYEYTSSPEGYAQMRQHNKEHKALKFYIPAEVEEETKQAYGDKYIPSLHAPVVILMPHKDGEVLIEGKKYKEIGFLPATTNPNKSGAVHTEIIRRSLLNADGSIKTNTISPVQTTSWKIPGKAPKHLDTNSRNTNVRDLLDETLSVDVTSFARAMAVAKPKTEGENPKLVVNIPNYKGKGTTTPITVFATAARDVRDENGKNVFDYFIEGNVEKALSFNWRIEEVTSVLKEILGDTRYLDATADQLEDISKKLNSTINRYIRLSGKTSKFKIENYTAEDGSAHSKLLLDLGGVSSIELQNNIDEVKAEESDQVVFNILKAVFLNQSQTAERKLSSTGQYLIYQVDYSLFDEQTDQTSTAETNIFASMQVGSRGKKNNLWRIEQDIRDGLFSMSKASLDYRAEGIEFNLPVERFDEYGNTSAVENTTTFQPSKPADAVEQEATTSDNQVVDATTGETVRTETPIAPQEEQKQDKSATDESSTKPRERKRRRVKGAKYEGDYQSLGEDRIYTSEGKKIAPMKFRNYLKSKGITEEHWNRMSSDEKQNEIDCC